MRGQEGKEERDREGKEGVAITIVVSTQRKGDSKKSKKKVPKDKVSRFSSPVKRLSTLHWSIN